MPRPARPSSPQLDTDHSLYTGLVGLWYNNGAGTMIDALGNLTLTASGGAGTATGSYGAVGRCDATDEAFGATAQAGHKITSGCVAWYGVPIGNTNSTTPAICGISYDSAENNPYFGLMLYRSGTNGVTAALGFNYSNNFLNVVGGDLSAVYGSDTTLVGNDASNAQALYLNGASAATGAFGSVIDYGTNPPVLIGPLLESGRNLNCDTMLFLMLNRAMTGAEVTAFDADPWEIMRGAPPAAPTLSSATITETTYTEVWSAAVTESTPSRTLHGTNATIGSLSSGSGTTTLVYAVTQGASPGGNVYSGQTITVDIGASSVVATNGAGSTGNAAITGNATTNSSTTFQIARDVRYYVVATTIVEGDESAVSNEDNFVIGSRSDSRGSHGFGTRNRDRFLSR